MCGLGLHGPRLRDDRRLLGLVSGLNNQSESPKWITKLNHYTESPPSTVDEVYRPCADGVFFNLESEACKMVSLSSLVH